VAPGAVVTFTAAATASSGTLTYQWYKNGLAIGGATSTSYVTAPVSVSDNGTVYKVVVTDGSIIAISSQATLTVNVQFPESGDLRFQQVASPAAAAIVNTASSTYDLSTFPGGQPSASYPGSIGTPLLMGTAALTCDPAAPANCDWGYSVYPLPSSLQSLSVSYLSGPASSLASALAALPASTSVVTSLDLPPGMSSFGMAVASSSQNAGFDPLLEVVPASAVQATVVADGLKSRVVTAVTFDSSGMADLLSYGWKGDTATRYDATSVIVAPTDVAATATNLGAQGYIITAFGGNDANSYILVGTKVQGNTTPRPTFISTESVDNLPGPPYTTYSPMLVIALGYGAGSVPQSVPFYTFVYQQ